MQMIAKFTIFQTSNKKNNQSSWRKYFEINIRFKLSLTKALLNLNCNAMIAWYN